MVGVGDDNGVGWRVTAGGFDLPVFGSPSGLVPNLFYRVLDHLIVVIFIGKTQEGPLPIVFQGQCHRPPGIDTVCQKPYRYGVFLIQLAVIALRNIPVFCNRHRGFVVFL